MGVLRDMDGRARLPAVPGPESSRSSGSSRASYLRTGHEPGRSSESSGSSRGPDSDLFGEPGAARVAEVAGVASSDVGNRKSQVAPDGFTERLAVAAEGGVPKLFADAFARLQLQRPAGIDDATWRRALDDAGRFLDAWGEMAKAFAWTPGDLFDVPRDGRGGLVWSLQGEAVRALGPEHAITTSGRVFDRTGRAIWASVAAWNAAQSARTSSLDPTR